MAGLLVATGRPFAPGAVGRLAVMAHVVFAVLGVKVVLVRRALQMTRLAFRVVLVDRPVPHMSGGLVVSCVLVNNMLAGGMAVNVFRSAANMASCAMG